MPKIVPSSEQNNVNVDSQLVQNTTKSVAIILDDRDQNNENNWIFHFLNGRNKIPAMDIP